MDVLYRQLFEFFFPQGYDGSIEQHQVGRINSGTSPAVDSSGYKR